MKVAVIGAGASGLFVAGLLQKKGFEVSIFDKNEKAGKKLYITGKGRCNLTNLCSPEDFLTQVVRGEKFLRSAIHSFSSEDAVKFFEGLSLKTKVERGNRVFPLSDKSSDVIKVLEKIHCKNVEFCLKQEVVDVAKVGEVFEVKTKSGKQIFDRVIVATGGKSYSQTGSTGFGYKIAKKFGHEIVPIVPALCPIVLKDDFVKDLQGVSLKNVTLKVNFDGKKKDFFGEMLFTDKGISGPIVLTASSFVNRSKDVKLALDFKPALTEQQLDARLLREFEENKNKDIKNVLKNLLPKAVAEVFWKVVLGAEEKQCNAITKQERQKILENLKNFTLHFGGLYDLEAGIITSGGIDLKGIDPKTFESKHASGLYFLGEVLDCDALTGGFNLQIAWATAYSCAKNFQ